MGRQVKGIAVKENPARSSHRHTVLSVSSCSVALWGPSIYLTDRVGIVDRERERERERLRGRETLNKRKLHITIVNRTQKTCFVLSALRYEQGAGVK